MFLFQYTLSEAVVWGGGRLAFETSMPQWKGGSEFKAVREGKKS
jgi:hypothetical protein